MRESTCCTECTLTRYSQCFRCLSFIFHRIWVKRMSLPPGGCVAFLVRVSCVFSILVKAKFTCLEVRHGYLVLGTVGIISSRSVFRWQYVGIYWCLWQYTSEATHPQSPPHSLTSCQGRGTHSMPNRRGKRHNRMSLDSGMIVVILISMMYMVLVFGLLFYVKNDWCDLLFNNFTVSNIISRWPFTFTLISPIFDF